jgi:hypothetical protein
MILPDSRMRDWISCNKFLKKSRAINAKMVKLMETEIDLNSAYLPSEDLVARDIEGELIIIPLTSGIGDAEDEIYTMNETGRAIWERLDGRSLRDVAEALSGEFEAQPGEIEKDVVGLASELLKRKMLVPVSG